MHRILLTTAAIAAAFLFIGPVAAMNPVTEKPSITFDFASPHSDFTVFTLVDRDNTVLDVAGIACGADAPEGWTRAGGFCEQSKSNASLVVPLSGGCGSWQGYRDPDGNGPLPARDACGRLPPTPA